MPCAKPRTFRGAVRSCKKCEYCLGIKRWFYRSRILAEFADHPRTWFVTLTLRRSLTDKVAYAIIQRWMKRVRKSMSGSSLRYACVAERGSKSTKRLHYHVVLHGPVGLTQRIIRRAWRGGISEATLVENGNDCSSYSTKMARYAVKGGKFRFSLAYGSRAMSAIWTNPMYQAVMDAFPGSRSVVRVHGVRLHRGVLPPEPDPWVYLIGGDLWKEAESCRPGPISRSKRRIPMKPERGDSTTQTGVRGA